MHQLKDLFFFSELNDKQFKELEKISKIVKYKKGSIAFFEGEEATSLFILIEGVLQVYKTDIKGNRIIMHHFFPKTLVAELANLEHIPFPASAEFETDGAAIIIDYEKFEEKFLSCPNISKLFIRSLTKKIKYLENVIDNNLVMNSTARVAKFICEHENDIQKLKKREIAADLNMTPETLSRILKKFVTLKLIKKEKEQICILDKEGLLCFY
ncbi:transcriptional regulator, Crp/Fnr family [hydrothermal vent metagenome]|uniref:Transcriptional regulator, Crp/Fnr family n=1 Tax=hydrothermal vent metagenome TaxID=652676 RepID=A0A1W1BTZ2_9ZZZZ